MIWIITEVMAILFAAAPARAQETSDYRLKLAVSVNADRVDIEGNWRIPARAEPVQSFEFLLSSLASEPSLSFACGGSTSDILSRSFADDNGDRRWRIDLAKPCSAGTRMTLTFAYHYEGVSAPQLRVTRREGFAGSGGELWYPQSSFADRETGEIGIETEADIESVATGERVRRKVRHGRVSQTFKVRAPTKFAFAFGDYRIVRPGAGAIVYALARSPDIDAVAIAETVAASTGALTEAFGAPPAGEIRVVEVDFQSSVLGTSEQGMLFVDPAEMRKAGSNLSYWAHELAHQWWGVGLRAASGSSGAAMLTEGMAQYGALLAIEKIEGADAASVYRREGRGPDGADSIAEYRRMIETGTDEAIALFRPQDQKGVLLAHRLATSKGALAMNLFAEEFGRDAFHGVARRFLEQHQSGRASWPDFETPLTARFGADARRFLEEWLHRPGAPTIEIGWRNQEGRVAIEIAQTGLCYRLDADLVLRGKGGGRNARIAIPCERRFILLTNEEIVDSVEFDPYAKIPTAAVTVRRRTD